MPSTPDYQKDLQAHPGILAYLDSNPPSEELLELNEALTDTRYTIPYVPKKLSLFQLCCYYGKKEHLIALLSNAAFVRSVAENVQDYQEAIRFATKNGHRETVAYLLSHLSNDEKKAAVQVCDYEAIRLAAENGNLELLLQLENVLSPVEKKAAAKVRNYEAIRDAARLGHTEIIKHLESHLSPDEKKAAVKADHYAAMTLAAEGNHVSTVTHFLSIDVGFAYMEAHDQEYGRTYVYPFVQQKLAELAADQDRYASRQPHGVFDVSDAQATLCFYMLRNLIRRGSARDDAPSEQVAERISFLLGLPAVRALAHQSLNGGPENELVRLARRIGNAAACAQLMQLPEVQRHAEQNNHYQDEGTLDLRALASDRESSMTALNESERQAIARLEQHYQQNIADAGGLQSVFAALKADLEQRYAQQPARITLSSGQSISLPLEWSTLQKLLIQHQLTDDTQYQRVLEAYYKHDVHSAYRYLSKPNHWMHPQASYVYVYANEQDPSTSLCYSTFEEYLPLITLLYLAANDPNMPATEGYTQDGRADLFIKQLALIGRAHNWDQTRERITNGQVCHEEYDDGQADKPSCYSGVKRRLFQSVLGHGLFNSLSVEVARQAINEQLKAYFDQAITAENAGRIEAAFSGMVSLAGDGRTEQQHILASINLSAQARQQIIDAASAQLDAQYPGQAQSHQHSMQNHLGSASTQDPDFCRFYGLLNLQQILDKHLNESPKAQTSPRMQGLFHQPPPLNHPDAQEPQPKIPRHY
ncbi:MAG: hypothetical protein JJT82_01210 [Legionellaceae bacterium]|nr:hypothetical protein [Legionellaceae bacterium]